MERQNQPELAAPHSAAIGPISGAWRGRHSTLIIWSWPLAGPSRLDEALREWIDSIGPLNLRKETQFHGTLSALGDLAMRMISSRRSERLSRGSSCTKKGIGSATTSSTAACATFLPKNIGGTNSTSIQDAVGGTF